MPTPTAKPCTAATIGFLAAATARIKRTAGGTACPFHGFFMKSSKSLPAVNASPLPCSRLTRVAGFEWGTGFYINPVPPEQAAAFLRETQVNAAATPKR